MTKRRYERLNRLVFGNDNDADPKHRKNKRMVGPVSTRSTALDRGSAESCGSEALSSTLSPIFSLACNVFLCVSSKNGQVKRTYTD